MSEESNVEKALSKYESKPLVRAVVQTFTVPAGPIPLPIGALVDNLLTGSRNRLRDRNLGVFIEELGKQSTTITPELLERDGFVHAIVVTIDAAARASRTEKVQLFARMLAYYGYINVNSNDDNYEQMLRILDDMTLREYQVLLILRALEDRHPLLSDDETPAQRTARFWDDFVHRIGQKGIAEEELLGFFARLSRTGFYESYSGQFWDTGRGEGQTTAAFDRFLAAVNRHQKEHPIDYAKR